MTTWAWSQSRDAQVDRVQTASTVLSQIMSAPDRAIPDGIMSGAKCIAIVPSMLKASFIFGANYGKGVATCRTDHGWSAPVFFRVTGGSFGFQAGGQASDLVLIIRTDDGMQHLLQSKFKLGADASASAGPVGRDAQAVDRSHDACAGAYLFALARTVSRRLAERSGHSPGRRRHPRLLRQGLDLLLRC